MGNASSSSSSMRHSDTDNGSHSNHDMDYIRDAVHSAVVGGGNSIAASAGNSSSTAGQLAMRHNIHYDVTQFVTDYDAINVFGLRHKGLRGLKYQKRHIPGVSRQGMRMNVSHFQLLSLQQLVQKRMQAEPIVHQQVPICSANNHYAYVVSLAAKQLVISC
jgi:hypothetical protein